MKKSDTKKIKNISSDYKQDVIAIEEFLGESNTVLFLILDMSSVNSPNNHDNRMAIEVADKVLAATQAIDYDVLRKGGVYRIVAGDYEIAFRAETSTSSHAKMYLFLAKHCHGMTHKSSLAPVHYYCGGRLTARIDEESGRALGFYADVTVTFLGFPQTRPIKILPAKLSQKAKAWIPLT